MVDKQGLLFDDMDDLTPEQRPFARKRVEFTNANELTNLEAAVKAVKPTILIGTSTSLDLIYEKYPKSFVTEPAVFPGPIPLCSDAFTHLPFGKSQSPSSFNKTQPSLPETITADNTLLANPTPDWLED